MDKQQAAKKIANRLLNGKCDTRLFAYIEEGAIAGWEGHEAQSATDTASLLNWIGEKGFWRNTSGFWESAQTKEKYNLESLIHVYRLFNPSGAAPQAAGPVWVKAKNYEGKGAWKLCRVDGSEPMPLRIVRPDFIVDVAGKSYSHYDVEYLDESGTQQVFTREHVENLESKIELLQSKIRGLESNLAAYRHGEDTRDDC